jgi:GDPmannose 4,6-dehydratase
MRRIGITHNGKGNIGQAMRKRALITGITGQDGSYLAELLLDKGYEVFGLVRRTSKPTRIIEGVHVIHGDLTDQGSLNKAVFEAMPDEVYNLAAQSFVGGSWQYPVTTLDITGLGVVRLLEAVRVHNPRARVYQASSSEMFGNQDGLLNEESPFRPRSPYGVAKTAAHYAAVNYRESYGMHISCGIMFNHESPRRGTEFVTQKIIQGIKSGSLTLGNTQARRDWGYAKDYVEAMWLMLQQDEPDDYVIATGQSHSVQDFLDIALELADKDVKVTIDPALFRPAEIHSLAGDSNKARTKLGWYQKTSLRELIRIMLYESS